MSCFRSILLASACLSSLGIASAQPSPEDLAFFENKIRPVLASACYECHSVDAKKLKADLFLDSRASILKGGDSGPSIVVGKPDESLLIETIRYTNVDLQMPPKTRLTDEQVADFEKWVEMGAPWPDEEPPKPGKNRDAFDIQARRATHWCWQPVKEVRPPAVKDSDWPLQPLDQFILAKLEAANLKPAPDADRPSWIRRLSFDLRGLPPTPEEVDAFVADTSDDAFEKVVDRYLASSDYGVKWGRHWLDLARYAESYGHEFDYNIPEAWKYRDTVVRAFNADVPHDQMIREAIAGDLLESPRVDEKSGLNESVAATGFWWLGEATHAPTDVRGDEATRIDNQIDAFSKSFLGLTVSCARCHDHKFDAISDEDYYSLTGFLQSSRRELTPRDPGGRIAEAATRLRQLQKETTVSAAGTVKASPSAKGEGVLWDFQGGETDGWLKSGEAFPDQPSGAAPLEIALLPGQTEHIPAGVWHSGLYGSQLHGVLRTPTFTLEKPELHIRIAATGNVRARVIIDGYFMDEFNALLFRGIDLKDKGIDTGGKWQWKRFAGDLRKYVGHRVYVEFLDKGDGYIAVDEVGYQPRKGEPALTPIADPAVAASAVEQAKAIWKDMPAPDYVLAMTEGTPENDRLHIRGGHKNLGDELPRRFLTALGGKEKAAPKTSSGRLELARDVASPDNPLTARVQVNRIWHHLTGRGIVPTVDDFGVMGEDPSHPELLDWLARRFVENGWSNKQMIRSIVLSRTYRMSCVAHPEVSENTIAEVDADNALLHKFRVRRLTSESIRDGILAISGRLDPKLDGPSVAVHLTSFMEGRGRPPCGPLDGAGRRSVFTAVRRNFLPPFHLAFDYPTPFSTMGRRSRSNVPAQSLVLMNDPFVAEQAKIWAKKLEAEPNPDARLAKAYRQAFSREPDAKEKEMLLSFLERQAGLYSTGAEDPRVWADLCHLLFNKKEFIFLR
ncbi:cytochrome c [Haloferula helveola]|uniref:Cytochrome c n=1 Tax=Haloferula helveola TaxID=490095 RepID=A0ABN6H4V9_9BACT|nr:cytochrome c [Haloferula helveola]